MLCSHEGRWQKMARHFTGSDARRYYCNRREVIRSARHCCSALLTSEALKFWLSVEIWISIKKSSPKPRPPKSIIELRPSISAHEIAGYENAPYLRCGPSIQAGQPTGTVSCAAIAGAALSAVLLVLTTVHRGPWGGAVAVVLKEGSAQGQDCLPHASTQNKPGYRISPAIRRWSTR